MIKYAMYKVQGSRYLYNNLLIQF